MLSIRVSSQQGTYITSTNKLSKQICDVRHCERLDAMLVSITLFCAVP